MFNIAPILMRLNGIILRVEVNFFITSAPIKNTCLEMMKKKKRLLLLFALLEVYIIISFFAWYMFCINSYGFYLNAHTKISTT